MSAKEKEKLNTPKIKKLGIIAGGGRLPEKMLNACDSKGIEPFIIAFKGHTNITLLEDRAYLLTRLGAAGQIIKTLKTHEIRDLVLVGSIRRPSITELVPDLRAAAFFAKLGFQALGDDGLLGALRKELEGEGFKIHGAHKFAEDLLMPQGVLGKYHPDKQNMLDIKRGMHIAQELGALDIGQGVIVQEGIVLGVEAIEGTDSLIKRCAEYKRKGKGGVLVKRCKPQQDRDLDLPTIGPETVLNAFKTGLSGIAIEAGASILLDSEEVIELANQNKIFVIGI